jgi:hypothetical protein
MRRLALTVTAAVFAALSLAMAASGGAPAPKRSLEDALERTRQEPSLRYSLHVQIRKDGTPVALHVRGRSDANTISVQMASAGATGGELLDGPFLYQEAPSGLALYGKIRWLRTSLSRLPAHAPVLEVLHALTPEPLLRVVGRAGLHRSPADGVYRGKVAYDDAVVRNGLVRLMGGIEFRGLLLTVHVARDGLIHRVLLTGTTADGSSTLALTARLYAFGQPVHVSPPKPGTFIDLQLEQLSE